MKPSPIRIALVILNYRFPEITLRCLASLSKNGPEKFTVFLVNNSPEDGSAEILLRSLAETALEYRYIESPVNGGFGDGMNQGIRAAMSENFSHVAPLNNDTMVAPDFGSRLQEEILKSPDKVLAGLVLDDITKEPSFNIGRLNRWTCMVEHIFSREWDGPFDFVSGCFVVFPSHVLNRVGLFREDYFMYAEDMEICMRLKKAGTVIRYCPSIVISHRTGSSADRLGTPKQYYLIRNHTHLILLQGNPIQKIVYTLYILAVLINQLRHPKIFRTVSAGVLDAFRGRMGKLRTTPC